MAPVKRELTTAELLYLGAFDNHLRGHGAGRKLMRELLPAVLNGVQIGRKQKRARRRAAPRCR